jgi:hypothetical protein
MSFTWQANWIINGWFKIVNTKTLMELMKRRLLGLIVALGVLVAAVSCDSDEKNARIQVWLTDGPGDYEELNIDVQGVEVHSSLNDNGKGWKSLEVDPEIINVLDLTNGVERFLGELELPAGQVSQIRLVLGDNNSLKVGGQTYNLGTPSAQQSGLKLQVHETLLEGVTYKIVLDFDVAKSVLQTGAGAYKLKPVIRTITEATSGAIKGVVSPAESTPAIFAIVAATAGTPDADTVATAYADENGNFLLRGIAPGSYNVTFEPNNQYKPTAKTAVAVTLGSVSDVGTVTIEHQ